jgi:hypothetical protein
MILIIFKKQLRELQYNAKIRNEFPLVVYHAQEGPMLVEYSEAALIIT